MVTFKQMIMKKIIDIIIKGSILLGAALFAFSCQEKESAPENFGVNQREFFGYFESGGTKTTLSGNSSDASRKIFWITGDQIAISSDSSTFKVFTYSEKDTVASAVFTGNILPSAKAYYAFYPNIEGLKIESNAFVSSLPERQKYEKGNLAGSLFPMFGYGTTNSLKFKNLCGVLVLNLKGSVTVSSIIFSSTLPVTGDYSVSFTPDTPSIKMSSAGPKSLTLDCGTGVALSQDAATVFYIVLPPAVYPTFSVKVVASNGETMTKNSKSLSIVRSLFTPTDVLSFTSDPAIDLSSEGTANCYLLPTAGYYSLDATKKGNSSETVAPVSAKLLWEDTEGLVKNVRLSSEDSKIYFNASGAMGNALVAACDAEGTVLWSWHLWSSQMPSEQAYINGDNAGYNALDRNLGAAAAAYAENGYGLYYQWGRKDPFYRTQEMTKVEGGTVAYSIAHPTDFIKGTDWLSAKDDLLWKSAKTMYDPCPRGYKVAPEAAFTGFTKTGLSTTTQSEFNVLGSWTGGWNFCISAFRSGISSKYPASGKISGADGTNTTSGNEGGVWTSSPFQAESQYSASLFYSSGKVNPINSTNRADALPIRCVSENSPIIGYPKVETKSVLEFDHESAKIQYEVLAGGGTTVTDHGVCWSTSQNPTTASNKKSMGTGTGVFTADIAGLSSVTTYYVRAYAVNSKGTVYGTQKSFTTIEYIDPELFVGDVYLATQEEVNAFAALGYKKIDGDLFLGTISKEWSENCGWENYIDGEGGFYYSVNTSITDLSALDLRSVSGCIYMPELNNITSLSFLSSITNIHSLSMERCEQIADISPISGLTSLQILRFISTCAFTDYSPLSTLTSLTDLKLEYAGSCDDISFLNNMSNLSYLNISGVTVTSGDLSPLSHLTSLKTLILQDMHSINVSEVSFLSNLTLLESLKLSNFPSLQDISSITNLTSLKFLQLFSLQSLKDISPITNLTSLEELSLSSMPVDDISPINNLKSLTSLELTSLNITDLSPISDLTKVKQMYLCRNNIRSISPLADLTTLTLLTLSDGENETNTVNDLTPLEGLINLSFLNISYLPLSQAQVDALKVKLPNCRIESYGIKGSSLLPPALNTKGVSSVTSTTAICGGNVIDDGGAAVTARGVCWSTSPHPEFYKNSKTTDGTGTGEFTSTITGLAPGTKYYIRAYATNSKGTAYGQEKEFTTSSE